jgi:uncharacterized protein
MELEIRTLKTEVRAAADFSLSGRAASYGVRSQNLGGFVEIIAPGAFTNSLNAGADVRCTFNHDPNHVLGRTKSGTLSLQDSAGGLDFKCQLDKTNENHKSVYAMVKRGDISECSFAFTVPDGGDDWQDGAIDDKGNRCQLRTLRNVNCIDVSAVTYPAYNAAGATQVSARALALASIKSGRQLTAKELADINGVTVSQYVVMEDKERRRRLKAAGDLLDSDLRARLDRATAVIAADDAKQKHVDLRRDSAAFVNHLERGAYRAADQLYPYEEADASGVPSVYPYGKNLASAVSAQLSGHELCGADSNNVYTKHSKSGTYWTVPYLQNNGNVSFGAPKLGGHPEWIS